MLVAPPPFGSTAVPLTSACPSGRSAMPATCALAAPTVNAARPPLANVGSGSPARAAAAAGSARKMSRTARTQLSTRPVPRSRRARSGGLRAEVRLHDLAHGVAGQLLEEAHVARALVGREQRGHVVAERVRRR